MNKRIKSMKFCCHINYLEVINRAFEYSNSCIMKVKKITKAIVRIKLITAFFQHM